MKYSKMDLRVTKLASVPRILKLTSFAYCSMNYSLASSRSWILVRKYLWEAILAAIFRASPTNKKGKELVDNLDEHPSQPDELWIFHS